MQIPTSIDCRREFAEVVARYRVAARYYGIAGFAATCFFLISLLKDYRPIGITGFIVCVLMLFAFRFILPKLICPNCHHQVDRDIEFFCPECGSDAIDRSADFLAAGMCRSCHRKLLWRQNRRRYKICYCTICGVHLADEGV